MDSSYSDSRPMFVQSPWKTNDSMPYPMMMNNEQSESQPSLKRPRLNDDTTSSNNNSWMAPPSSNTPPVNRGTAKIFYKTRMCAKFKAGTCMNGDPCNFAHGMEDLRQPPSNWQEIVGPPPVGDRGRERERERERERPSSSSSVSATNNSNWEDDQKIILRMKLCRKFCFGEECPYGDRCNFVHEDLSKFREESGKLRESSVISVGTDPSLSVENGGSGSHQVDVNRRGGVSAPAPLNNAGGVKTVYWKTRLCMKFENGQCPFGDNCHFAHGQAELLRHSVGNGEAVHAVASLSKQTVVSANEAFAMRPNAAQVVTADSCGLNDEGRRQKCLLKWSDSKKINRIYGDWIDDLPVGQKSTKPVES
ncbi:Zinc finger CCCH domain-containing protein 39 [Raphanus sativus]|uniref:Zinc finger CCCH domain-containing protein 39 n=1 Tax=Raphanus sativus TaxID=3726 RepID=A0A6J0JMJ5_RAPSA|nr:zinc finger CCCH domain-containing protein 39 [Raphanus sativus]KAJ4886923.1 Zinc finger CCCH domain-containing protein 39 [Raphanus sativus]